MKINEEAKTVIKNAKFLSLVTLGQDGTPHLIILGSGEVVEDTIVFGIYKMEVTQNNVTSNPNAWVAAGAMIDEKPKGYRFAGTAEVKDKQLIFTPATSEELI